ncbi:PSD1 and planctomycete cytochrome C domain-containing protein [Stieleria sp. JC731]|uniref:PSD1 and planctomycete cytochrome C domain-containing protein n=1 Tax=Pirellulaceae TaxID=2691357 RepID=UPI001E54CA6B|nr:PSD1 and planctomycete cytochrome C domain-containing protein [Stieleria sp. JC731]MCC9600089.1 PSD1 and planctomycete cytochrome C domain-containing protein [Stieleria sp. JC731]
MSFLPRHRLAIAPALFGVWFVLVPVGFVKAEGASPDFNRDIRPILAKHCYACHGPDEETRAADLRLDTQDGSRRDLGGYQAIDLNHPDESELLIRITSDDDDLRMPPAESHPPLKEADIQTIRQWIQSGAVYNQHWSFVTPALPSIPAVDNVQWCRNPIDRFVLAKLEAASLKPSREADRAALIRRVHMDLLGTVPSVEAVDRFLADDRPDAYERLVDRLIESPRYGERWARSWLDLARYSDTNGYEKDRPRTIWPYRDWVIQSMNRDLPFDQFSIEQLAGDMLDNPTQQQKIATGFHRNTMLNEEGGIDPLEYRFYAMVDRVATTGTVWMGLTTGCAQCHTHKFDPITHTDYYALMALMNNADEPEMNADSQTLVKKREAIEQQANALEHEVVQRELLGENKNDDLFNGFRSWAERQLGELNQWKTVSPRSMQSTMPRLQVLEDGSVLASGDATKRDVYTLTMPPVDGDAVTAIRIEALAHPTLPANGPGLAFYEGRRGDFFLSEVDVKLGDKTVDLAVGSTSVPNADAGNGKTYPGNVFDDDGSTGWSIPGDSGQSHRLVIPLAKPASLDQPWTVELLFERHYVAGLGHFRISVTTDSVPKASALPVDLQQAFVAASSGKVDLDGHSQNQITGLAIEYLRSDESMSEHRKPITQLRRSMPSEIRTMVLDERPSDNPRLTHRHHRGEYLQAKEAVQPAVPMFLSNEADEQPSDRLGLAQWLVSDANPLVGRVTANRAWREFFGTGIVKTSGDFGTQSESPTHPQLLDYLAVRLRDRSASGWNWSIKRLHREIVLSATYRQAVEAPPQSDPNNRLLSSFPYRRYDAERIRDAFLSASGLLTAEIGGPSVRPPQPQAVSEIAYGKPAWPVSKGADRYRRSLYTFSKRTAPFAAFATFDGPSGEVCLAKRDRSTTPLQALTLLNDAMYIEIAEALADQTLRDCASDDVEPRTVIRRMFRRVLAREPMEQEVESILQFYQSQADHPSPWMLVARVLMNLDEAITTP